MNCVICLIESSSKMCENCELYKSFKIEYRTKIPYKYVKHDTDAGQVKRLVTCNYRLMDDEYDTEEEFIHPKERLERNKVIQTYSSSSSSNILTSFKSSSITLQQLHKRPKSKLEFNNICDCNICDYNNSYPPPSCKNLFCENCDIDKVTKTIIFSKSKNISKSQSNI